MTVTNDRTGAGTPDSKQYVCFPILHGLQRTRLHKHTGLGGFGREPRRYGVTEYAKTQEEDSRLQVKEWVGCKDELFAESAC